MNKLLAVSFVLIALVGASAAQMPVTQNPDGPGGGGPGKFTHVLNAEGANAPQRSR